MEQGDPIPEPISKEEIALDKFFEGIRKDNSIVLSNEDRDTFLKALENPPEPNKRLRQALKHHKRLIISKL